MRQFFKKNENNDKLSELLPLKATTDYDMLPRSKYNNYLCRTERFRNCSFLKSFPKKTVNSCVIFRPIRSSNFYPFNNIIYVI